MLGSRLNMIIHLPNDLMHGVFDFLDVAEVVMFTFQSSLLLPSLSLSLLPPLDVTVEAKRCLDISRCRLDLNRKLVL